MKLTKTELQQMLNYCDWVSEKGDYYGNRPQFDYRHNNIVVWLQRELEKLDKPSKV